MDDTGAGISSLSHILKLAPDIIKLDRYLTSGIGIDPVRRTMASALITFAGESGAHIVAEGIETPDELTTLSALSVDYGQGFYLGRPAPIGHLDHTDRTAALIADCQAGASAHRHRGWGRPDARPRPVPACPSGSTVTAGCRWWRPA